MAVLFFYFFVGGDTVIPKSDFTIAFMGVRRSRQIITFHEVKEQDSAVDMVYGSTMFVVIMMMADLLPPKSICGCMTEDEGFS